MDTEDRYDMDKPHSYLPEGYKPGESKIKELRLIIRVTIFMMILSIIIVLTLF